MNSFGSSYVVQVEGVEIVYPDLRGRDFVAVKEASFAVRRGEKFAIVGPSGCGKTTLLKAIAGFIRPTRGRILVAGTPVNDTGPDRAIVFQDFDQLFPWRTVEGNVAYAVGVAKDLTRGEAEERSRRYLELVGIQAAAQKYPHMLSGGMKQRAALARALALEPEILLMDEPFGALDAITRGQLQLELNEIWRRTGVTIILVTHSIQEAIFLGHRVMVMTPVPSVVREIVDTRAVEKVESPEFSELSGHLRELLVSDRSGGAVPAAARAIE